MLIVTEISAQDIGNERKHQEFINHIWLEQSQLGISVIRLKDGKKVFGYHDKLNFMPASTIKIWYTLAAVDQLGGDFSYVTRISHSGEFLADGSLEGDLIIEASGDPSFGSPLMDKRWLDQRMSDAVTNRVMKYGINCIEGDVVIVLPYDSYPVCGSWSWEDIGNYYAGGSWGLNFNENKVAIDLQSPPRKGMECGILKVEPEIPGLSLRSEVISAGKYAADEAYVFGSPYDYERVIRGSIPSGKKSFRIYGSIPDPPLAFAQLLSVSLGKAGIRHGSYRVVVKPGRMQTTLVGQYRSPKLAQLAALCNAHSINLYSEAFGKSLLWAKDGKLPTGYPGEELWETLFSTYVKDLEKIRVVDACGLSPQNLLTPASMTRFLAVMYRRLPFELILSVLPKAGEKGTSQQFLDRSPHQQRIWIKSGSIANVLNYAGIFRSAKDEEWYAFALFSNHHAGPNSTTRNLMEEYLDFLAGHCTLRATH